MDKATVRLGSLWKESNRMKRVLLFAVAIAVAGTWVDTTPAFGGQGNGPGNPKSDATNPLCHIIGNGSYRFLYVDDEGLADHLASHLDDFEPLGDTCDVLVEPVL
jgi:hypothetical protein